MDILIIEDSKTFQKLLKNYLTKHLFFANLDAVSTYEELKKIDKKYDLYICDFVLPDATNGEHIKDLISKGMDVIVLTQVENLLLQKDMRENIVDFLSKNDYRIMEYLAKFITRIYKNRNLNVIVAEDSTSIRKFQAKILRKIKLNVFEAKDGKEALKILDENQIDLIITDLNMPEVDGEQLIAKVRETKNMSELPIIVISGNDDDIKFIKTLKLGANDYLKKPFLKEELIVRANNILEIYDGMKKIKTEVQKDSLTGAFNRYFLENTLDKLFQINDTKSIVMLDIDHFKHINDTYGHQLGDKVLRHFVDIIKKTVRKTDYVVRYGGEEFLIFMPNTKKNEANIVVHKIKKALTPCENINFTFSAGISDEGESLSEMIKTADERLYTAKKTGRNKVVIK